MIANALPVARLGDTALTLDSFFRHEHQRGRLVGWLRQAVTEVFLLDQAGKFGLAVTPNELQRAADLFRRSHQLLTVEEMNAWLVQQRQSLDQFEARLAGALLLDKLRRHVSEAPALERFRSNPADFGRVTFRLVVVQTEPLARELLSQIEEEGADLATLAVQHSRHPSAGMGGLVGPLFLCQLPGPLRAAIVSASPGSLIGPIASPEGFVLVRVEERAPPELDEPTAFFLAEQAFEGWINEQLASAEFATPLLEALA